MTPKAQHTEARSFTRAVAKELKKPQRGPLAILSLNLGCPHKLFARTHASLVRETVALLPITAPAFKTMDIRADRVFVLISGEVSELMDLVEDTHQGLIVLEAQYPDMFKFCMSWTIAKVAENADDLLARADAMLTEAVAEFA